MQDNIDFSTTKLSQDNSIPQISESIDYAVNNPREVARIYFDYLGLIRDIMSFTNDDLQLIERAHEIYDSLKEQSGVGSSSASHAKTRDAVNPLGDNKYKVVNDLLTLKSEGLDKALNAFLE